jgi:hypothetical protein
MNLFGLIDFYNGLEKTKEIGGCIEAASIRLADGTEYQNAVITRVDYSGNRFYSIGFMDESGIVRVVHVDLLSLVLSPEHKKIADVKNRAYQKWSREQTLQRVTRLLKISKGAAPASYQKELQVLLDDLGVSSVDELAEVSL